MAGDMDSSKKRPALGQTAIAVCLNADPFNEKRSWGGGPCDSLTVRFIFEGVLVDCKNISH